MKRSAFLLLILYTSVCAALGSEKQTTDITKPDPLAYFDASQFPINGKIHLIIP